MDKPGEYDVVHPIWQRGRDWGIKEERKRLMELVERAHPSSHNKTPKEFCAVCNLIKGEN